MFHIEYKVSAFAGHSNLAQKKIHIEARGRQTFKFVIISQNDICKKGHPV
jgi:hypothetical protein